MFGLYKTFAAYSLALTANILNALANPITGDTESPGYYYLKDFNHSSGDPTFIGISGVDADSPNSIVCSGNCTFIITN